MKRFSDGSLNVRCVNLGSPDDTAADNTVIGLLKSIVVMLSYQ